MPQGVVTVSSGEHVGRVIDLAWAPLPGALGGGNVLALATEDGSLVVVDAVQTVRQPSQRQRLDTFRGLLTTSGAHSASVSASFANMLAIGNPSGVIPSLPS